MSFLLHGWTYDIVPHLYNSTIYSVWVCVFVPITFNIVQGTQGLFTFGWPQCGCVSSASWNTSEEKVSARSFTWALLTAHLTPSPSPTPQTLSAVSQFSFQMWSEDSPAIAMAFSSLGSLGLRCSLRFDMEEDLPRLKKERQLPTGDFLDLIGGLFLWFINC